MGERGPNRKPAEMQKRRGNPGKRAERKEVAPPAAVGSDLECPPQLKGEARAEWFRLIDGLNKSNLYTAVDRAALAAYCDLYGMYLQACEAIGDMPVVKSKRGAGRLSPWFTVKIKTAEKMQVYLKQFGFSPATRIQIGGGDDSEDEFTAWKKKGGKK